MDGSVKCAMLGLKSNYLVYAKLRAKTKTSYARRWQVLLVDTLITRVTVGGSRDRIVSGHKGVLASRSWIRRAGCGRKTKGCISWMTNRSDR